MTNEKITEKLSVLIFGDDGEALRQFNTQIIQTRGQEVLTECRGKAFTLYLDRKAKAMNVKICPRCQHYKEVEPHIFKCAVNKFKKRLLADCFSAI